MHVKILIKLQKWLGAIRLTYASLELRSVTIDSRQQELRRACHVNAEEAGASVKADEEKIKARWAKVCALKPFIAVWKSVKQ